MGEISISKAVQAQGSNNESEDEDGTCKTRKTSSSNSNLPGDCLNLIFKRLKTRDDRNSFGLTCRHWLYIQNNNRESLWYRYRNASDQLLQKSSPESVPIVVCKLLSRFPNLKYMSLTWLPKIKNSVILQSQLSASKIQNLSLDHCSGYSDTKLSIIFSWVPRLTYISLKCCHITDKGLEVLTKCCPSLETVNLLCCQSITDSGINFLLQNCRELATLYIDFCSSIAGIGFQGCPQTLTHLEASGCRLIPAGINAIVSGGGLQYLSLSTPYEFDDVGEGCINTKAVVKISKGCPLLKKLILSNCEDVELEGWEAISSNCKDLEFLYLFGSRKLCDLGLIALCNGCNKLSKLYVNYDNSCSSSAVELFKSRKPNVMRHLRDFDSEVMFDTWNEEKEKGRSF
ncbi:hypothetical protein MKX01_020710 [Papaver californicum]|nr:hypothetical protein MKX01_020710 [Papaver californicum]